MSTDRRCEEIQELVPELALGIAEAEDRARALEHLARCPECSRHLRELSSVADDLLPLAPAEEPGVGFEGRVLDELQAGAPRGRRTTASLRLAAAAAAAAIVTATGIWLAFGDDREVAERYRSTLAEVSGEDFDATGLYAPGDREVGHAFGYQGTPSWILVTVDSAESVPAGAYQLQLVTEAGRRIPLEPISISAGRGSEGGAIPVGFHDVAEVRMLGPGRGNVFQARFGHEEDK